MLLNDRLYHISGIRASKHAPFRDFQARTHAPFRDFQTSYSAPFREIHTIHAAKQRQITSGRTQSPWKPCGGWHSALRPCWTRWTDKRRSADMKPNANPPHPAFLYPCDACASTGDTPRETQPDAQPTNRRISHHQTAAPSKRPMRSSEMKSPSCRLYISHPSDSRDSRG